MVIETIAFGLASLVHAGVLVHGYQHNDARTAESVISLALLTGLVLSWIRPERSRDAGVGAQGFALIGTVIGVFTIIVGVGPRTAPDVVYHVVILAVLTTGLALAVRLSGPEAAPVASPAAKGVAAPTATAALAEAVAVGVLAQAAFAGGFLGGYHSWLAWHENVGDYLTLLPLASLLIGLTSRRHQRDATAVLLSRVALVVGVLGVVATGHIAADSPGMLAIHIPAAIIVFGLVVFQALTSMHALPSGRQS